jgi:hypothetical protein
MSHPRDADWIIATWLDDGPLHLPEETRRAILVGVRTQRRARRPTFLRAFPVSSLRGLVAAAAIGLAVGAVSFLGLLRAGGGPGSTTPASTFPSPAVSSSPSPSATATPSSLPRLTETFVSSKFGYTIRYPADWVADVATGVDPWSPADVTDPMAEPLDYIAPPGSVAFRAGSTLIPDGAVVDEWIRQYLTMSSVVGCNPPRTDLEPVTIDGQPGRLRGFCNPGDEVEATVVVGRRVYLFTLFLGDRVDTEAGERALFNALLATIDLRPEAALVAPSPGIS